MNELLKAAKAVIDDWDRFDNRTSPTHALALMDAVKQAENPPADYNEWTARHSGKTVSPYELWTAGQRAERERCREIVITMGGPDVPELLRQIDSGEE